MLVNRAMTSSTERAESEPWGVSPINSDYPQCNLRT